MNEFLSRHAANHAKLGVSRTWVLPEADIPGKAPIAAYYTLAGHSVIRDGIPMDKSLPRHPIPVVLLARLAVEQRYQKRRLGEKTLVTALRKAVALNETGLPAVGIVIDVLDQEALEFYQHVGGFETFTNDPMRLFLSMPAARRL